MNPKTADGAGICYGDVVYYVWWFYDGCRSLEEPQIRQLTIAKENLRLTEGNWTIVNPVRNTPALVPNQLYRDRRRVVTICRNYWKGRIKQFRAKLNEFQTPQTKPL